MPPKVASLFGGGSSRPSKPVASRPAINIELSTEKGDFEKILSEQREKADPSKPKFIYAAAEKAKERRALDDALKARRYEREIQKLEREHGPLLRFDSANPDIGTADLRENDVVKQSKSGEEGRDEKSLQSQFEEMKERYLKRLQKTDILRLDVTSEQMELIVNWVELSKT